MSTNPAVASIYNRIQDPDLSLSDFPGGILDKKARLLTDAELKDVMDTLDYLARGTPDIILRRRYHNAVYFLKKDVERRSRLSRAEQTQELARIAKKQGKKPATAASPTCPA